MTDMAKFQKGRSGNPAGAKRSREWRDAIRRALARRGNGLEGGLNALADKLVDAALNGDTWALREIGDRLDGKPRQETSVDGSVSHTFVRRIFTDADFESPAEGTATNEVQAPRAN